MIQQGRSSRAKRLRRLGPSVLVAALCLALSPAPGRAASNTEKFWVDTGTGMSRLPARLVASGRHVRVFAAFSSPVSAYNARAIVNMVERRILPTDLRLFGTPAHFSRFTVLMAPLPGGTLGYFDENDILANRNFPSNHQDLLYVRPPSLMPDVNQLDDVGEVVAHELQHLLNYRIRVVDHHLPPDSDWLNEGLAFYAQVANGFWTPRDQLKLEAASADPSWPVTALNKQDPNFLAHARIAYGRSGLFISYLAARFDPNFAKQVIAARGSGMDAIDQVLRHSVKPSSVAQAFADWGVANAVHGRGVLGYGKYHAVLRSIPTSSRMRVSAYPAVSTVRVAGWGQRYITVTGGEVATLFLRLHCPRPHLRVAVLQESTFPGIEPEVHWLRFHGNRAEQRIDSFGAVFDKAVIVINDVGPVHGTIPASMDNISVTATLAPASGPPGTFPGGRHIG